MPGVPAWWCPGRASRSRIAVRAIRTLATANVRSAGFYSLLGEIPARVLGDQAEDSHGSPESGDHADRTVVPRAPPCASTRTASRAGAEAPWALRVLRDHRELAQPGSLPERGQASLAGLAQSAI